MSEVRASDGRKYPWEMRGVVYRFRQLLEPREIEDGESSSDGIFIGFAKGSVPGGKGVYTVLKPNDFERAEEMGWVGRGKEVIFHGIKDSFREHVLEHSRDSQIITTLTDEGKRLLKTPAKDLIRKRPKLSGKMETLAQVYEGLQDAGVSGMGNILEGWIYKGNDPWDPKNVSWYKSLPSKYPDIVTPRIYTEIFLRPTYVEGWRADLWDIVSDKRFGAPLQHHLFKDTGHSDWFGYTVAMIFEAFSDELGTERMKQVLGARNYKWATNQRKFPLSLSNTQKKDLQKIILRHFTDKTTQRLKDVLAGKTVVDPALTTKINILKRLSGNPVAERLLSMYESGKFPSEDDLREIRHQLYMNRMRNEAKYFRTANLRIVAMKTYTITGKNKGLVKNLFPGNASRWDAKTKSWVCKGKLSDQDLKLLKKSGMEVEVEKSSAEKVAARYLAAGWDYGMETVWFSFVGNKKPFNVDTIRNINSTFIEVEDDDGVLRAAPLKVGRVDQSGLLTKMQERMGWQREIVFSVQCPEQGVGEARLAITRLGLKNRFKVTVLPRFRKAQLVPPRG